MFSSTQTCTDSEKNPPLITFINFKAVFLTTLKWPFCEYFKHDIACLLSNYHEIFRIVSTYIILGLKPKYHIFQIMLEQDWLSPVYSGCLVHLLKFIPHTPVH